MATLQWQSTVVVSTPLTWLWLVEKTVKQRKITRTLPHYLRAGCCYESICLTCTGLINALWALSQLYWRSVSDVSVFLQSSIKCPSTSLSCKSIKSKRPDLIHNLIRPLLHPFWRHNLIIVYTFVGIPYMTYIQLYIALVYIWCFSYF